MEHHDIFVIGASLGGIPALRRLLRRLPGDWPATAFIVQHTSEQGPGLLSKVLGRAAAIAVEPGTHDCPFHRTRAYVAPPGRHLLIQKERMLLSPGPKENWTRPAIDPLFRSAAVYHGPRVVGVVLTGLLDDGSAGLWAVTRCGGKAIVQDPEDVEHGDMPRNALRHTPADLVLSLEEVASAMDRLAREPTGPPVEPPQDLLLEVKMTEDQKSDIEAVSRWGQPAPVVCPECGGTLWTRQDGNHRRYRCHVGHVFTAEVLADSQGECVEASLWAAVRALQEHARLHQQLGEDMQSAGLTAIAGAHARSAAEASRHAQQLMSMLRKSAVTSPRLAE